MKKISMLIALLCATFIYAQDFPELKTKIESETLSCSSCQGKGKVVAYGNQITCRACGGLGKNTYTNIENLYCDFNGKEFKVYPLLKKYTIDANTIYVSIDKEYGKGRIKKEYQKWFYDNGKLYGGIYIEPSVIFHYDIKKVYPVIHVDMVFPVAFKTSEVRLKFKNSDYDTTIPIEKTSVSTVNAVTLEKYIVVIPTKCIGQTLDEIVIYSIERDIAVSKQFNKFSAALYNELMQLYVFTQNK